MNKKQAVEILKKATVSKEEISKTGVISPKDIEALKEALSGKELNNEDFKDDLKEKEIAKLNSMDFARLFIQSYCFFNANLSLIESEKELYNKFSSYLGEFDYEKIRSLVEESGGDFGCYLIEEKIKLLLVKERNKFEGLINMVLKVFGED